MVQKQQPYEKLGKLKQSCAGDFSLDLFHPVFDLSFDAVVRKSALVQN